MVTMGEVPEGGAISRKDPGLKILNGVLARLNKVDDYGRRVPKAFNFPPCCEDFFCLLETFGYQAGLRHKGRPPLPTIRTVCGSGAHLR